MAVNQIYTRRLQKDYLNILIFFHSDDKDWLNGVRDQLDYREKVYEELNLNTLYTFYDLMVSET